MQVSTLNIVNIVMTMFRVETCTDPCGLNWSDEAASPAADDDYIYQIYVAHKETEEAVTKFWPIYEGDHLNIKIISFQDK